MVFPLHFASGGQGPSARGAYMLRNSVVLVLVRFRVWARHHLKLLV
jgi:hypothetical protein